MCLNSITEHRRGKLKINVYYEQAELPGFARISLGQWIGFNGSLHCLNLCFVYPLIPYTIGYGL